MLRAIFLLFLSFTFGAVMFALIAGPRAYSKWWLARNMYLNIDEDAGAKKWEAEYAKTKREFWKYKDENGTTREYRLAQWLWPHPDLGGVMARPHWWRRRYYVQLGFVDKPWPMPYFKSDIAFVTVTYTSEANPEDGILFPKLERRVARGLSRPWHEDLFKRDKKNFPYTNGLEDHRPEHDQVTFEVAEPMRLPARVSASDELNGRVTTNGGRPSTEGE